MKCLIEKEQDGLTIKQYIARYVKGLSRRLLIDLKNKEFGITVNGVHATVRYVLHEGDWLELLIEDDSCGNITPTPVLPDILYEDEDIVAVNKPAGILTHPSIARSDDNLASYLAYYYSLQQRPFVFRVLNLLDGVASGVVIVAKNHLASSRLSASLQNQRVLKHYYALVEGTVKKPCGVIEANIKRCLPSILSRCVCEPWEGEYALTTYRVVSYQNGRTLVDAFPHTGRTHQLRVHLQSIGHPIVGDFLYGKEEPTLGERVALHCASMSFPHPTTGKIMEITAPLPKELMEMLQTESEESKA